MALASQSVFSSGADESLATPDFYSKLTGTETFTSVKSVLTGYDTKSVMAVAGAPVSVSKGLAKALISLSQSKSNVSTSNVLARITGSSKEVSGAFKATNSTFQKVLSTAMGTQNLPKTMQVTIDGAIKTINITDINSIDNLGAALNKLTGVTAFEKHDKSSIASFATTLLSIGADMGLDGTAKSVVDSVNDPQIINYLSGQLALKLAKKTNTSDLKYLSGSSSYGVIYTSSQDIIYQYCRSFSKPSTTTYAEFLTEFANAMTAFTNIKSDWDHYYRKTTVGVDDAVNLRPLICSNARFYSFLQNGVLSEYAATVSGGAFTSTETATYRRHLNYLASQCFQEIDPVVRLKSSYVNTRFTSI